jgi:hypothetical protein
MLIKYIFDEVPVSPFASERTLKRKGVDEANYLP